MKKGKANVPPQMRGMYAKQQEMAAMRQQMIAASKPGADGLPVFNLFVRTKRANVSVVAAVVLLLVWFCCFVHVFLRIFACFTQKPND